MAGIGCQCRRLKGARATMVLVYSAWGWLGGSCHVDGSTTQVGRGQLMMSNVASPHALIGGGETDEGHCLRLHILLCWCARVDPRIEPCGLGRTGCWPPGLEQYKSGPNVGRSCLHVRTLHRVGGFYCDRSMYQGQQKTRVQSPQLIANGMCPGCPTSLHYEE